MFTRIRKKLPVAASALLFLLALPSIATAQLDVKVAGCPVKVASAIANLTPECIDGLCQSVVPLCDQCVDCGTDADTGQTVTPICLVKCPPCPDCPDCKTACIDCGDEIPICPDECSLCLTCTDPVTEDDIAPICPDECCPTCATTLDCGTDATGQTIAPICLDKCCPTCATTLDCKNATGQTVAPICPIKCPPCPTCATTLDCKNATGQTVAPTCLDKCPTCPEIPTCQTTIPICSTSTSDKPLFCSTAIKECDQCVDCKNDTGQTVAPICLKDCPCPVKATPVPSMDDGLCLTITKKSAFANSVITMVDQNDKPYTPQPSVTIKTQTALSLTCTQAGQTKPTKCSTLFDFHMSACDCATACPVKCDDRTKQACCKKQPVLPQ